MANLITLDEFKIYKGINSTTYDEKLEVIITSVSEFIKGYCNRAFIDYYDEVKTEYYNSGLTSTYIIVKEMPIVSITEFAGSIDGGVTYEAFTYKTDYIYDADNGFIYSLSGLPFLSDGPGILDLRLKYKAGYETAPADIKQATMDLVDNYRNMDFTPAKQVGNAQVTNVVTGTAPKNIPPHIGRILDMHRSFIV